jgi:hypothetical protein
MEMGGGQMPPPQPGGGQYPPPQQPQQQQYYSGGQGGPAQAAQAVQRAVRTPETKPFFLTSEFIVWAFTVIGVGIAGAVVGGDNGDAFGAPTVWTLITVIGFAYIVSRGVSKAGTKYGNRGGGSGF